MRAPLVLDRAAATLHDAAGRRFDPATRTWRPGAGEAPSPGARGRGIEATAAGGTLGTSAGTPAGAASGVPVDAMGAVAWLQHESGHRLRVPIGVIGPRNASPAQLQAADAIGEGLARAGLAVVCGGRHGVMQAVCEGLARGGGLSIGLLPDADPGLANPFVGVALATGIGEARNALVARAALCLVAIGNSFGTLSEVALGRQFGKTVIGLLGAAEVDGVCHVEGVDEALERVALCVLGNESR
jgi:uncharacterized protein (TIGR00725 family)